MSLVSARVPQSRTGPRTTAKVSSSASIGSVCVAMDSRGPEKADGPAFKNCACETDARISEKAALGPMDGCCDANDGNICFAAKTVTGALALCGTCVAGSGWPGVGTAKHAG